MDYFIQDLVQKYKGTDVKILMNEERQTRKERVEKAFSEAIGAEITDFGAGYELLTYYARLAVGKEIEYANEKIYSVLTSTDEEVIRRNAIHDKWSLWLNPILIRMYMYFGSKGSGALSEKNEKLILDMLWERMLHKNDIALSRMSTWHMTGSENHDLNYKVCSLITSQIFKSLPEYADRIYPDLGKGGGSGYWFHNMYLFMGGDKGDQGPEGKGDYADGKEYNAKDHYEAWCVFFKEYFKERAKRGFFLEASATGYMKWTLSFISLIMEFCEDEELRGIVHDFFDLIWCEWAQEQLYGRRGGAKTRFVYEDKQIENDSMYYMAKFWLGGGCDASHVYFFQLLSEYEFPEIVWDMVINRHEMGSYEYYSRRPGEEDPVFPRPRGYERTMMCKPESRMTHYSYITPHYILGTQFDHPYMFHSHLSVTKRWNGLIIDTSPDAYIFPTAFVRNNGELKPEGLMYQSVQHKNVLICKCNKSYLQINPEWFPGVAPPKDISYGIYLGKAYDVSEINGWYIISDEFTYVAFRPAYGSASWENERILVFEHMSSPAVIHAESKERFKTAEEFVAYIEKECLLKVNNTVVPGYYTIDYSFDGNSLYMNAANNEPPRVNGEIVCYETPHTFKSPYITSEYGSGIITVKKGDLERVFDFN